MRRGLSVFVLAAALLTAVGTPTQGTPGPCVSRGEYRQVHRGMTRHHVHRVFDTRGRRTAFSRNDEFTFEIRRYRGCPRHTAVSVGYGNGRVKGKSASWR